MEMRVVEDVTNRRLGWIRLWAVALLATTAVCLLGAFGWTVRAEPASFAPSTDGVQAVAATLGRNTYGLYLVDHARGAICVYQYVPRERKLKLTAVRRYTFDVRLGGDEKLKEIQSREP